MLVFTEKIVAENMSLCLYQNFCGSGGRPKNWGGGTKKLKLKIAAGKKIEQ